MFRVANGTGDELRTCLVCSDKISAMHFGMDTCRACSSFFKRTKTLDRQYPCRQGERNCVVNKGRRCRFDKCLAIGMQYDGPMRIRTKRAVPLLETIEVEYRSFLDRRRTIETELIESAGRFPKIPHHREVLYLIREDETNTEMFNMTIDEAYRFFKRIFPPISEVTELELIFKEFVGKFIMIDYYHRTIRIFGELKKYIMCSAVTCIEVDRFLESEVGDTLNDTMIKSSALSYVEDEKSIFLPIFLKARISDKEFFALIALLMSEIEEPSQLSLEASQVLEDIRQSVFRELQKYYRIDLGIDDFSVRLGNLMSLNHAMQECKSLFQVYFRFYATIFDEKLTDEKMKNLFL